MKKLIFSALSLFLGVLTFTSCNVTTKDLMTADVKTGGLLTPTSAVPYKLGGTPSFNITLDIPQGPEIKSIEIHKNYTGQAAVLDQTVPVTTSNVSGPVTVTVTYNYAQLISGLTGMPADETVLAIGDAWTLNYVSVMADGRKVDVSKKTVITVANKYAGYYNCVGTFIHPTAGPRPINEKKFLTPIDANSVWGPAGDLGTSGYLVRFTIDPVTYQVTASTWDNIEFANIPGMTNAWDPVTGVFTVNYFYVGSGGNRLIEEVWTPTE